jgi:hypothetical protein
MSLLKRILAGFAQSDEPAPTIKYELTAKRNALPAGTKIRSLRDDVPGLEQYDIHGYLFLEGRVVEDENGEHGTGDADWAVITFGEDDPVITHPAYIEESGLPQWIFPREDLEVLE